MSDKKHVLFAGQGGGRYGAFAAGALKGYYEDPDTLAASGGFGVSVNSINFAKVFQNDMPAIPTRARQASNVLDRERGLVAFWRSLEGSRSIYRPWGVAGIGLGSALAALRVAGLYDELRDVAVAFFRKKTALYDNTPLRELLENEFAESMWDSSIRVGVTNLNSSKFEEISLGAAGERLTPVEAVLASTSMPYYFPPVSGYMDGGVTDVTPLRGVFHRFAELRKLEPGVPQELIVFRCSPLPGESRAWEKSLLGVLKRTTEIWTANTDREDFERAALVNELAKTLTRAGNLKATDEYGYVDIFVISPSREDMEAMGPDSLKFDPVQTEAGIKLGCQAMQRFLADRESCRLENFLKGS